MTFTSKVISRNYLYQSILFPLFPMLLDFLQNAGNRQQRYRNILLYEYLYLIALEHSQKGRLPQRYHQQQSSPTPLNFNIFCLPLADQNYKIPHKLQSKMILLSIKIKIHFTHWSTIHTIEKSACIAIIPNYLSFDRGLLQFLMTLIVYIFIINKITYSVILETIIHQNYSGILNSSSNYQINSKLTETVQREYNYATSNDQFIYQSNQRFELNLLDCRAIQSQNYAFSPQFYFISFAHTDYQKLESFERRWWNKYFAIYLVTNKINFSGRRLMWWSTKAYPEYSVVLSLTCLNQTAKYFKSSNYFPFIFWSILMSFYYKYYLLSLMPSAKMQTVPFFYNLSKPTPLRQVHLSLIKGIGMLSLMYPIFSNLVGCLTSIDSLQKGRHQVYNFIRYAKYKKHLILFGSVPFDFISIKVQ